MSLDSRQVTRNSSDNANTQSVFALLLALEQRALREALATPQEIEAREEWSGVAFKLSETTFVAGLNEVVELLSYPVVTRVPATKSWVRGLANVRGSLLPVADLAGFFFAKNSVLSKRSRVLVVSQQGMRSGLLVDEVIGLRHFFEDDRTAPPAHLHGRVQELLIAGFRQGGATWPVLSMRRLAEFPDFLQAAL